MPLFKPKKTSKASVSSKTNNGAHEDHEGHNSSENGTIDTDKRYSHGQNQSAPVDNYDISKAHLVFRCQLAHGSSMGFISGFSSVRELYQKIAACYDLPPTDILFCTLNTPKLDMFALLGGQIGLEDFIFAHQKGQVKEIELVKSEDALGLTITDNGAGYAFIKRIREGSVMERVKIVNVGDHIEKINSEYLVGKRHFEVANILRDIPKGSTFTLRLIEPQKSGFGSIGPRGDNKVKRLGLGSGRETLRFKSDGSAEIQQVDNVITSGVEKINAILENFMGISDNELSTQIWDLAEGKKNSMDFAEAIDNSDLESFGFTDEFVIELWGAITDAKSGRNALTANRLI